MDSHNVPAAFAEPSPPLTAVPQLSPPPVPHLSPSLSASVNSSSLPSPEGDIFSCSSQARLSGAKYLVGHRSRPQTRSMSPRAAPSIPSSPSIRSHGSSSSSSGWARHVRTRTLAAQQAMARRVHPYDPRRTATPLELRFTTRALGHPTHIGLTLEDVIKGKNHFQAALHAMPDSIIKKAYQAKLAVRESITNRLRLTLSELESLERLRDYLNTVKEEQDAGLAICSAHLDNVASVMEARGLQNVEDDGEFCRAAYADELIALSISNAQLNQVRECMLARPGLYHVPGGGNNSVDGDQDQSEEVGEEDEEEFLGDPFPELPSSDPSEVDLS